MSLTESCASQEPSRNSTIECTSERGWMTTSIDSGGTPNRCDASMSSSPLLIRVEESMLILAPIDQVGWRSASSLPMDANVAGSRCRNGPPEAVRTSRRTSARVPQRSAWWSATCSLSIGTISAPVRVREVGQETAGDDQRLLVGQGDRLARGERRRDRRQARGPDDRRHDLVDVGVGGGGEQGLGSGGDLDAGRQRRPKLARHGGIDDRDEPRAELPRQGEQRLGICAPGRRASTMREPVGMMADDLDRGVADRPGGAEQREALDHRASSTPSDPEREEHDGRRQEHGVEAVEHAAVPGQDGARVLDVRGALDERFDEIAELARDRRHQADGEERRIDGPLPPERPDRGRGERGREPGDSALPRLLRRDDRREAVLSPGRADVVGRGVAEPDDGEQQEEDPRVALLQEDETRDRGGEVEAWPSPGSPTPAPPARSACG